MKRIICALLCVIFSIFLIGCGTQMERAEVKTNPTSMFVAIEGSGVDTFWVVYHRDTKVMYAVSNGSYNAGNFTLLVNPDGSPMIWDGG